MGQCQECASAWRDHTFCRAHGNSFKSMASWERDPVSFKSHHLLNTLFPDAGMLHSVPQYNTAHGATLMIAPMSIVHHGQDGSARAAGARGQKNAILLHEHTPNQLVSYMPV
jgi:hypothetical protein